jgi:hypothetical protein
VASADKRVLAAAAPVLRVASLVGPAANIQILAWAKSADAGGAQANILAKARGALMAKVSALLSLYR